MGGICRESIDMVEGIFESFHHPVQRNGKPFYFVTAGNHWKTFVQIPRRDPFCSCSNFIHRPQRIAHEEVSTADCSSYNQR